MPTVLVRGGIFEKVNLALKRHISKPIHPFRMLYLQYKLRKFIHNPCKKLKIVNNQIYFQMTHIFHFIDHKVLGSKSLEQLANHEQKLV